MERREAPRRFAKPPQAGIAICQPHTPSFRDPSVWRVVGVPWRAGPCEEPGRLSALHRGTRCRRPTLLLHPASRSTAPSTSQGEASVRRM